jgi:hypothetical protein
MLLGVEHMLSVLEIMGLIPCTKKRKGKGKGR